jgi:hypothetical protein
MTRRSAVVQREESAVEAQAKHVDALELAHRYFVLILT